MGLIFGSIFYDLFGLIAIVLGIAYAFFSKQYRTWKNRGFPVPEEPSFPMGNFQGVGRTRGMEEIMADLYKKGANEKIIGCYMFAKPILLVRDMELVKNILVKDFSNFHDRGFAVNLEKEPLAGHLFLMSGQEWRNLRIKLTPTFTSGKMKMMFPTLIDVGKQLNDVFRKSSEEEETEVKDILSRYTTDVISSVAFGIESNSLKNPDVEFRKMGNELAHPTTWQMMLNLILFAAPKLADLLPVHFIPKHLSDFFIGVVRDTMDYRQSNNVSRSDFLQLLLQLKTLGYVKDADNPEKDKESIDDRQKFTLNQAAAQAFLFFFAGFETSSATMQFALYELALNPDIQKRVQDEIEDSKKKNGGVITYEGLMQMDLLDRVVSETLRKYPVAAFLIRECNKEYELPDTNGLKLLPGDTIWFPLMGYQRDPQFFPNPDKFDPDRFLPEVKETRPHYAYMPFGEGPRNCIGNRFGLMQTKAGLALLLAEFSITPSKKTPIPMVFAVKSNILAPKEKMYLKINKRSA